MAPRCEGESDRKDEEDWQLKDVVFVEDVKTAPIGTIFIYICEDTFGLYCKVKVEKNLKQCLRLTFDYSFINRESYKSRWLLRCSKILFKRFKGKGKGDQREGI